jgi:hypothetical protein
MRKNLASFGFGLPILLSSICYPSFVLIKDSDSDTAAHYIEMYRVLEYCVDMVHVHADADRFV